jgi:hypothetical protein
MDLATLGLVVENGQIVKARAELDKLGVAGEAAAARTQRAWQGVGTIFQRGGFATGVQAQQEIMQAMIRDQQSLAPALDRSTKATRLLQQGLVGVALQATATSGPVGRLAQSALLFGAGTTAIIAVAAAVGLAAAAYRLWTRDARENKKAQDDLRASLDGMGTHAQLVAARIQLAALESQKSVSGWRQALAGVLEAANLGSLSGLLLPDLEKINREMASVRTRILELTKAFEEPWRQALQQSNVALAEARLRMQLVHEPTAVVEEAVRALRLELGEKFPPAAARTIAATERLTSMQNNATDHSRRLREWHDRLVATHTHLWGSSRALADALQVLVLIQQGYTRAVAESLVAGERWYRNLQDLQEQIRNAVDAMQGAFANFFERTFRDGVASFRELADAIRQIWSRLAADLLAQRLFERLSAGATKTITGAGVGFGVGSQAGPGAGLVAGVGAAALLGAGPWGIAIAGVAGLVGGLFGLGKAAEDARRRLREVERSLDAFRASVTPGNLDDQIAAVRAQTEALRQTIPKGSQLHHQLNVLEQIRIAQLREEAAALRQAQQEDLRVRLLRARGKDDEAEALAFALEQQREYARAVREGADATYLAQLAQVQYAEAQRYAAERIRETIGGLTATIDVLRSFTQSLKLNTSLTALSPVQQLAEARRQYEAVLGRAQAGDQGAAAQLPDVARAFLEASRAVNASGGRFQVDFLRVLRETEAVAAFFEHQRSLEEQHLEALERLAEEQQTTNRILTAGFKVLIGKLEGASTDVQALGRRLEGAQLGRSAVLK